MALFVCSIILVLSIVIALLARRGAISDSMHDIMAASGSFGAFLIFFISVGEIYSIGTLLGGPGSIYARGANYGTWFICYFPLAYAVGYFLNPVIWRLGQLSKAVTISDVLGWRFNSEAVQVLTALIGIVFLIPWIQNQFAGLAILVKYLGLGIDFQLAVVVSAVISFIYIAIAGIRAPAYVSILKDILLILAVIGVGMVAIFNMPGGISGIFHGVADKMPKMLTVTTEPITAGATFTLSTIIFQMLGFYVLPITMQGTFASKSEKILRRNSILMPLYMVMFPFLILTAYFALLTLPGLEKADYALLAVAVQYLPSWVIGLIAGGAALTGILVTAFSGLCIGGLFSKNVLGVIKPDMKQSTMVWSTQAVTGLSLLGGVILALFYPNLMLTVVTISYSGLTQAFVGILLACVWKNSTKWGIGAGLGAGILVLLFMNTVPYGLNKGFVALIINFMVAVIVSLCTKPDSETIKRFEAYKAISTTNK
jgi:solute:Na+ symporter, SSS family